MRSVSKNKNANYYMRMQPIHQNRVKIKSTSTWKMVCKTSKNFRSEKRARASRNKPKKKLFTTNPRLSLLNQQFGGFAFCKL